ncbi:MAG: hypothetical protein BAJALOKI1v1_190037 [Promethearchaeota archaeon]|nr:MAG: hypothetical protein BAJALOKI1v1_190037 [Candidatus Lokiarchaeota archaeon]
MKKLITQKEVSQFLTTITNNFPNFLAGIITDRHGFPIASKLTQNFPYKENTLALEAISREKSFITHSNYIKVKRTLNEQESIKLLLILKKPNVHIYAYNDLKRIIRRQNLF